MSVINILTTVICLLALSCGKSENQKQKEESSKNELLILGLVFRPNSSQSNGCIQIDNSTTTSNSNSMIKNITISDATTQLCSSECYSGLNCAIQLTFANAGSYSVTLTQANQTRKCGTTTQTQIINVSYGPFSSSPYSLTTSTSTSAASPITITETVTAGTIRGVNGTLDQAYSGICVGSSTTSGNGSYTIQITKTN